MLEAAKPVVKVMSRPKAKAAVPTRIRSFIEMPDSVVACVVMSDAPSVVALKSGIIPAYRLRGRSPDLQLERFI